MKGCPPVGESSLLAARFWAKAKAENWLSLDLDGGKEQVQVVYHLPLNSSYFQWPFQEPIDWRYLPYIRPI